MTCWQGALVLFNARNNINEKHQGGRMNFSEYIVTEGTGSSIDPLGFLGPSSALADTLFRQFTVLSNKPAYLGFLCFAFSHLAKAGKNPGARGFSEEFRNAETLWGWLNFKAGTSILNVTSDQIGVGDNTAMGSTS